MNYLVETLILAKNLHSDLANLGVVQQHSNQQNMPLYYNIVTNSALCEKTERLFGDGHYARAVEEAFKLLDNLVQEKAGLLGAGLTGAKLMQLVLSPQKPVLKLNEGISASEKDEQLGYMQILAGSMSGIRNPRAHDSDWEDTEQRALQLLALANHLIERIETAKKG